MWNLMFSIKWYTLCLQLNTHSFFTSKIFYGPCIHITFNRYNGLNGLLNGLLSSNNLLIWCWEFNFHMISTALYRSKHLTMSCSEKKHCSETHDQNLRERCGKDFIYYWKLDDGSHNVCIIETFSEELFTDFS